MKGHLFPHLCEEGEESTNGMAAAPNLWRNFHASSTARHTNLIMKLRPHNTAQILNPRRPIIVHLHIRRPIPIKHKILSRARWILKFILGPVRGSIN
jgi:hypothetical protein